MATPLPANAACFSLNELLACTGGRVYGALADAAMHIEGVSTDTRSLMPGQAFIALTGEHHDGHEHLAAAAAAGATLAIVEHEVVAPSGLTLLRVGSALEALASLARHHVERWRQTQENQLLAVTGSAGKTTTLPCT